ncbi:MAG: PQQ-dependent sugar dehydrogenase [Pyrinomonadaceae bacterium]
MRKAVSLIALLVVLSWGISAQTIVLDPVLSGLSSPLYVTHAHDGSGRLFIVQQGGIIKVLQPGATIPTNFLDITTRVLNNGERGLLGLAFHPSYETNRRFFVHYTRNSDGVNVIAEYHASAADPNIADTTEAVILPIPQPFSNHNGGMIEFGPDGFLYIAKGDGGSANDPGNRAQNINELLGKMLRIDIDQPPYASPPDNPFAGVTPGRDEIWATGLRNPFRFSFDRQTGDLYIGDVGQSAREEVDFQSAKSAGGINYGWRIFEGSLCTGLGPASCTPTTPYTFPITEYGHTGGRCSITGGYVYRGARASLPFGSYIFGDFCTGEIFIFDAGGQRVLLDTTRSISSFGEDEAGEIYVVGLGGTVERIRNPSAPAPVAAGQLLISEFRLRGPGGVADEFIEVYNASGSSLTVNALDSSAGFAVVASDGVARFTIPNGAVIPAGGHYLGVNSVGYSLGSYPGGNASVSGDLISPMGRSRKGAPPKVDVPRATPTATGDATYTIEIPDNAGVAIFNTANPVSFVTANRLDAAGSTSEANVLYKEGSGYPSLSPSASDHSFVRDNCGKQGSVTTFGPCPANGLPVDTNNNANDFYFVDTNGISAGAGQRLGAPGPENLSSPIQRNSTIITDLLDPCVSSTSPANRVRDYNSDPNNNSTFGTLELRRTFTNITGGNVARLRFRIIDLTAFPVPSGIADLRPLSSIGIPVTVDRSPCGAGMSTIPVAGTTLEAPPDQPFGGGFNSSLSAGTITLANPLAIGASVDVRFVLGVQRTGQFRFFINVEALP